MLIFYFLRYDTSDEHSLCDAVLRLLNFYTQNYSRRIADFFFCKMQARRYFQNSISARKVVLTYDQTAALQTLYPLRIVSLF